MKQSTHAPAPLDQHDRTQLRMPAARSSHSRGPGWCARAAPARPRACCSTARLDRSRLRQASSANGGARGSQYKAERTGIVALRLEPDGVTVLLEARNLGFKRGAIARSCTYDKQTSQHRQRKVMGNGETERRGKRGESAYGPFLVSCMCTLWCILSLITWWVAGVVCV